MLPYVAVRFADSRQVTDEPNVTNSAVSTARRPPSPATVARRRRRVRAAARTALALTVTLALAVVGDVWYLNSEIHRVKVSGLSSSGEVGAEAGTENILMVGSTSRCALKVQNPNYGLCDRGVTGVNSDVVMILHLNPKTRQVTLLSIPRDTFIPNARSTGANKIDAALAEGPSQLVAAIEEDFGIPIQHYVELNFDTFAGVVDALGGIHMYFPQPVFDAYSGLDVKQPGCLQLNGAQALAVVRARHLQYKGPPVTSSNPASWPYEPESDLARIRRDHEFLRVLTTAVAARGLGNPLTDQGLASAVAPRLHVDSGLSATDLAGLLLTYRNINVNTAPQLTTPVIPTTFGSYVYKGGNYGDIVWPAQPQDFETIDQFLGVTTNIDTRTGAQLPPASTIHVAVLDGTQTAGKAAAVAKVLTTDGFAVSRVGTSTPVADQTETVVYYAAAANANKAEVVLHTLNGPAILALDPAMVPAGSQVTVLTGTNLTVLNTTVHLPAAKQTTIAASPVTTGTTATTAVAAGAPTASVEPLMPWDPRSCSPTAGAGP